MVIYAIDLNDAAQVEEGLTEIEAEFSAIDILVNNAGVFKNLGPFWETGAAAWLNELSTNLVARYLATRHVMKSMTRRKSGLIIKLQVAGRVRLYPLGHLTRQAKRDWFD